jgi:hypothetical protein
MSDGPPGLPTTGRSAFVGQPPNTLNDYYTIKGLFRITGMTQADPMKGYFFAPKPPPGYVHESRVPGVLAGMILVIFFIVVPTGARLVLRARRHQMKFGSDDWVILIAAVRIPARLRYFAAKAYQILASAYPIAQILGLFMGGGSTHMWEVTYAEYDFSMHIATFCKILFYVAVGFIKISIALFIRRLADQVSRKWRWFCDIFIASVVGFVLLALFWLVFSCDPLDAQWSLRGRESYPVTPQCADSILQARVLSGIHVSQGLILLSAPLIILWTIQMDRSKKIRLFVYWIIGGVCVLGGLLRQIRTEVHADMTWEYVAYLGTTCLDLVSGLLMASLPILDGAFVTIWRKTITRIRRTSAHVPVGQQAQRRRSHNNILADTDKHSQSSENIIGKVNSYEMDFVATKSLGVHESSASSFIGSDVVTKGSRGGIP